MELRSSRPPGQRAVGGWEARAPHRIAACWRRSSSSRLLVSCRCSRLLSSRSFRTLLLGLMASGRAGFTFFWKERKGCEIGDCHLEENARVSPEAP